MKTQSLQLLSNAALFASALFIPKLAKEAFKANDFEIGLIVAAYGLAIFLSSYIFGRVADIRGRKLILTIGLGLTAGACLLQVIAFNTVSLIFARLIIGFCAGIFPAALIAYAFETKIALGRISAFGSLGMATGSFLAGLIVLFAVDNYVYVFTLSAILLFVGLLVALQLPGIKETKVKVPIFPTNVIKNNLPAYLAVLIRHTGAVAVWTIYPLFLTRIGMNDFEIGRLDFWIGFIYFINLFTQFLVMPYLDKYKSHSLITAGCILSIISFISFTFCTNIWQIMPTQIVLAIAWSSLYVGALKFVMERNVEHATSLGLLSSTLSISNMIGPIISGSIAGIVSAFYGDLWGYKATMYLAAFMALSAFLLFKISCKKAKC